VAGILHFFRSLADANQPTQKSPPALGGVWEMGIKVGVQNFDENFVKNSGWFLIVKSKSRFIGSIFGLGLLEDEYIL
jgi:hypothetical protein